MAKIEMDMSEYKAMEESKELLKQSLQNERDLKDQIKILSDEKIKVLEDAKMKVIKTVQTEKYEHLLKKRYQEMSFQQFCYSIGISQHIPNIPEYKYDDLINIFFEKISSHSMKTESITTVGLDEIKEELKIDIQNNIDNEIKEKLDRAEKLIEKNKDLLIENGILITKNSTLLHDNDNLTKLLTDKDKELSEITDNNDKVFEIKKLVSIGYSFWNSKYKLTEINELLKKETN